MTSKIKDSDGLMSSNEKYSFSSMFADMLSQVHYKLFSLMFIIFLLVSSDVFIMRLLSQFNGAVDYKCPTSYGIILQGIFLVLACVMLDVAIEKNVI